MATELTLVGAATGSDVRALLFRDSDEKVFNRVTEAYDTYVVADYADYLIPLTETPAGSRRWIADNPAALSVVAHNAVYVGLQTPGTPSVAADEFLGSETMAATAAGTLINESNILKIEQNSLSL